MGIGNGHIDHHLPNGNKFAKVREFGFLKNVKFPELLLPPPNPGDGPYRGRSASDCFDAQ